MVHTFMVQKEILTVVLIEQSGFTVKIMNDHVGICATS